MKSIISSFLSFPIFFFAFDLMASPIYLSHENNEEEAKIYKKLLLKKYGVPNELISMKKIKICEDVKSMGKLSLCIKKNGDLYWVSVDDQFVNKSLKIFQGQ
jgi:hypothetical protein